MKSESEVAQSCPMLGDPMDCSPLGSSIHGIFQARLLEWGAIAFSSPLIVTSKSRVRTSQLAQGLGIHLPIQGTQVRSLVQDDATGRGAAGPVHHD